jgi:hypothetical protein
MMRRRQMLRWGFKLGILVAWISDSDHGYDRRRMILDNLDRVLGRTRAAPIVDLLSALNDEEFEAALASLPRIARGGDPFDEEYEPEEEEEYEPELDADEYEEGEEYEDEGDLELAPEAEEETEELDAEDDEVDEPRLSRAG